MQRKADLARLTAVPGMWAASRSPGYGAPPAGGLRGSASVGLPPSLCD